MSRTAVIVLMGLVLVAVFVVIGWRVPSIGIRRAAQVFLIVWSAVTVGNMVLGVEAGYGVVEEVPFLLINFLPAALVAAIAWIAAKRSADHGR